MTSAGSGLHVLLTADASGGVWTYVMALLEGCRNAGVTFTLALTGPAPDVPERRMLDRLPHVDVHHRPFRLEWMANPWDDIDRSGIWLRELADASDAHVVHLNSYACATEDFGRPVLVVGHSCVCSWWRAVHGEAAPGEWDTYRARVSAGLRAAARVVAPTRAMRRALQREHGDVGPIEVIHNGLAPSPYGFGRKESFVFTAGRFWDQAKNLAALDAIAHQLPWPVLAAGPVAGPSGDRQVPARHLTELGPLARDEVRRYMQRAAIYASPVLYEPYGLSILEAAQSGCALVLSDIASLRELWLNAAIFVDPRDPEALRTTIMELIDRPDRLRGRGAAAARRALRYSGQTFANSYLDLYRQLARPLPPDASGLASDSAGRL